MALLTYVGLAVIAGLIAHHGFFIHGEWHLSTVPVTFTHLTLTLSVLSLLTYVHGSSAYAAYCTAVIAACYLTSLFTSIIIYRLFFHRLSKFPGPKLAAVSKFWHIYHLVKSGSKNYLFLQETTKKYGPIVRTGPNEISIFHPAGIQLLDGWNNHNTKDAFYDVLHPRNSAVFIRDVDEHKERRKAWTQALSTKSMDVLRPRLAEQARSFSRCIAQYGSQVVDINTVMTWFSFDLMGEVVFGEDFGLMVARDTIPAIGHRDRALALVGPFVDTPWIVQLGFNFATWYEPVKHWYNAVNFCEDQMHKRLQVTDEKKDRLDMMTFFIKDYESLSETRSIQERNLLLAGTAISAIVAGSDTTRASLIGMCWFLSRYPEHAKIIQAEVENIDISNTNVLATLPHLNGAIKETLRLVPPAMTGGGRITGPEGLRVGDTLIPAGVKVTAPKYVIMRLEEAFEFPDEFIPERWYSRPELIHDDRAYAPFSFGGRQCVGKSLAVAEIRLMTATLLKNYNIRFAPGYNPQTMWDDMKDQVTCHPGQVLCVFESRE